MSFAVGSEELDHDTDRLHGKFACCHHYQSVGTEVKDLCELIAHGDRELGDAAGDLAVLVHSEPVSLGTGLNFAVGEDLDEHVYQVIQLIHSLADISAHIIFR